MSKSILILMLLCFTDTRWFLEQVVVASIGNKPDTTVFPCNRSVNYIVRIVELFCMNILVSVKLSLSDLMRVTM